MVRFLNYSKALAPLAFLAILGCGDKNLVPVRGVVTLDGQPVEGAIVKFIPKEVKGQTGHEAMAETDASGNFSLTTLKPGDGAWRGVYKVCVQKIVMAAAADSKGPKMPAEAAESPSAQQGLDRRAILSAMKNKRNLFPKKYMNANTTPIEVTVPTDGLVRLDIKSEEETRGKGR